ncbi:hypothetical protein GCM10010441_58230 [Kitasatospora paracochleata]|uniref:Uncharacterized protein n=1 Tax=Kitasatospora paracochleata TaxID=58354 RepID=A0ABT1J450_9ACTN|nr:hypothetical protein [Kitasatospora paracochleata]
MRVPGGRPRCGVPRRADLAAVVFPFAQFPAPLVVRPTVQRPTPLMTTDSAMDKELHP